MRVLCVLSMCPVLCEHGCVCYARVCISAYVVGVCVACMSLVLHVRDVFLCVLYLCMCSCVRCLRVHLCICVVCLCVYGVHISLCLVCVV